MDVWVRPASGNAQRVIRVLERLGFVLRDLSSDDLQKPDQVVQLGRWPIRIDVLTSVAGVDWDEAWAGRVPDLLDGLPVNFIGREHLIRNKRAVGRPQDLADLHSLEDN